jgi:hypothetical protein
MELLWVDVYDLRFIEGNAEADVSGPFPPIVEDEHTVPVMRTRKPIRQNESDPEHFAQAMSITGAALWKVAFRPD